MPQTADDRCSKQNARFSWFTTIKQVENTMLIRMAVIHPYKYTYIDTYLHIGMYCGRAVGFKSCAYTVSTQVCTSGNTKLQGPESKPAKQLRQFSLVEICQNMVIFAMKYCIVLNQWISERNFNFAPLRHAQKVVFVFMLHVFIANLSKRKQHFWVSRDFLTEFPAS